MKLYDQLRDSQGGAAIDNLASSFNIPRDQAAAALHEVLPALTRGLEKNTLSRGGLADLVEALGTGRHQRYVEDPRALADPLVRHDGNEILGHVLGSKTSSRLLAQRTANRTGLGADVVKSMLPYIASMVMGTLSKSFQSGLNDNIRKLQAVSGASTAVPEGGFKLPDYKIPSGPQDIPSSDPGRYDGGSPYGGNQPLPVPDDATLRRGGPPAGSGDNPYGDLSDILRRGGKGSGDIGGMLRDLIGSITGFKNTGAISWLIRLIVVRYGWQIVKFVLGRLFVGRRV